MQQEFIMLSVKSDLKNKKIIITTNNTLDRNTIDEVHIELYESARRKKESSSPISFKKEIIGETLEVTLMDWPLINTPYIFVAKDIKNVLGEYLKTGIKKKIVFESTVTQEVKVLSPSMHENIESLTIKCDVFDRTPPQEEEEENKEVEFESIKIEIAKDNAFVDTIISTNVFNKDDIRLKNIPSGQYFLRARVEEEKDKFQYGVWSDVISFIFNDTRCNESHGGENVEPPYIPDYDDMTPIVDDVTDFDIELLIEPGVTPESLIFEFSKSLLNNEINPSNIIIMRKDVR